MGRSDFEGSGLELGYFDDFIEQPNKFQCGLLSNSDVFAFFFWAIAEVGADELQTTDQCIHGRSQFVGRPGKEARFELSEIDRGFVGGWRDLGQRY